MTRPARAVAVIAALAAAGWLVVFAPGAHPGARADGAATPVALTVSRAGFVPDRIEVRASRTTHLKIETSDVEHCVAIDGLRVEKRVVPGRGAVVRIAPEQPGTHAVRCCLGGEHAQEPPGQLTVLD